MKHISFRIFINGEMIKLDLLILRIKNKSTIINSLKSHGNATMQYTHPKRGSLEAVPIDKKVL